MLRKLLAFSLACLMMRPVSADVVPAVRKVDVRPLKVGDDPKFYIRATDYNALVDHTSGYVNLAEFLPFGYVKDGSVDYSSYWVTALASLPATGGMLRVPAGIWTANNISIGPRQWVVGEGPGTIIRPTSNAFLFTSVASGIRFYSGIRDLAIDGSAATDHLIKVVGTAVGEGPTFLSFLNINTTGWAANKAALYFTNASPLNTFNHLIKNFHAYNAAGHGLWITNSGGTQGSSIFNVEASSFEGLGGHGIWLDVSGGGKPGVVNIKGCNLEGNTLSALQVDGVDGMEITSSYFEQVSGATPIVFSGTSPSSAIRIEGNGITGGSAYGVDFNGTYTIEGVISRANKFTNQTTAAYRATNLAHSTLGPDKPPAGKPMVDWSASSAWNDLDVIDSVNSARASSSDTTYFSPPKNFLAKADSTGSADSAAVIQGMMNYGASVTVDLPPGTFRVNAELWATAPNTRIRGAGRDLTTIVKGGSTGTKVFLDKGFAGFSVSDLTIDANDQSDAVELSGTGSIVERVRFKRIKSGAQGVWVGAKGVVIRDCEFLGRGDTAVDGTAIALTTGTADALIEGNRIKWLTNGIYGTAAYGTADIGNIKIIGNEFDGGWWFRKTFGTNSGGTVTYGASTLVDSAHNPWSGPAAGDTVRVLPTRTSGTSTAIGTSTLTASGANFTGAGVAVGDLVRTGSSQGVVSAVNSATVLTVEEWISTTDMSPLVPSTGSFTVYQVILSRVASIAGTTVNVDGWRYLASGATVTPSAGTLYEIAGAHPNYQGIQFGEGARNVTISGNVVRRSWSDAISYFGLKGTITGNVVEEGQDTGITVGNTARSTRTTVSSNTVNRNGANGIAVLTHDNTVSGNVVTDNMWVNLNSTGPGGIETFSGAKRNLISGNAIRRESAASVAPYLLTDASGSTGADANVFEGNRVSGAATSDIALTAASQPWMRGNIGVITNYASAKPGNFGTAVLVGGTVTVTIASVLAGDLIQLTRQVTGGTVGHLTVGTITAGTSFVINSSSGTDTSTVGWEIIR